jgi:hypothetical protein
MPPGKTILDQSTARMGPEVGPIYAHLWVECVDLNVAWIEFETLFTDKDNFETFNEEASRFLAHLQDLMVQDLMLRVARMVDTSSKQENLSLPVLMNQLPSHAKIALNSKFDGVKNECDFAVRWRNKRYAHKDLSVTLGNPAKPLPDVNRMKMGAAIKGISGFMDDVDQAFGGGVTAWGFNGGRASKRLITRLKAGRKSIVESLRLPGELQSSLIRLAQSEGVPVEHWIAEAVAQRIETELLRNRTAAFHRLEG